MDTEKLTTELRPYLLLFLESILESPIQRGKDLIPYETVVAESEEDTVSLCAKIGLGSSGRFSCGSYCHLLCLELQVEPSKYEKAVSWVREFLFQTVFTKERLKIIANKIISDVSQCKRRGNKVVYDLMRGIRYDKDCNHYWSNMLRQQKFLTTLVEKLDSVSDWPIIQKDIEKVREILTSPSNIVVHMGANLNTLSEKFSNVLSPWEKLFPDSVESKKMRFTVKSDHSYGTPDQSKIKNGCIVGMGCIESSYFCQTVECIKDFNDPDLPALLVFLQYLTQLEGPLWKQIRGRGLAYGYRLHPAPNEGLLYLTFFSSSNITGSYTEAKSIIESHLKSGMEYDKTLFHSAKSSLIFEIIDLEKCIAGVFNQSVVSYFKMVDHDFNKTLVSSISKVEISDMAKIASKYVSALFDPEKSKLSVVCQPTKVEEIGNKFKELKFDVSLQKSLEEVFLNHM